ncbi:MAG: esterase/lipase family protein, partial [Aeoliella sp.]
MNHVRTIEFGVFQMVLSVAVTAAQTPQNPSPMVEHTRAHERLEQSVPAGQRFDLPLGKLFVPEELSGQERLPLIVHFHGATWVPDMAASQWGRGAVIAVQLGSGSAAYTKPFADNPALFESMLSQAEQKSGNSFRPIILSSWSAGYGSIRQILKTEEGNARVDAVILLDGLHTDYVNGRPGPLESQLSTEPLDMFVRFAQAAVAGEKAMLLTHSEVFPGTFASTTETADYLVRELSIKRKPILARGPLGMQQLSEAQKGRLLMQGFAGNSAPDHVDHLHALDHFWEETWKLVLDQSETCSKPGITHLRMAADGGQVKWADVYLAVARAMMLDESAMASRLPRGSIDLDRHSVRTTLLVANLAMPGLHLEREQNNGEELLLVTIDRDRLQSHWRVGKTLLRRQTTGSAAGADARYGLTLDESWETAGTDVTRVVLLHGFNSSPLSMAPLAGALRERGHPCAIATYPNDQAIDQSARWLADELRALDESRIALVTHSMGGLVARWMLEDPQLDPGRVDRLVMIAPPNHGTSLARLAYGVDVWEHWLRTSGIELQARFYRSINDGLAEAAHDLCPDSPFLRRLNARKR